MVDASFQFYEHLLSIDLSDNIIEDIEDKSFAAQVMMMMTMMMIMRLMIELSDNIIEEIEDKSFAGQVILQERMTRPMRSSKE